MSLVMPTRVINVHTAAPSFVDELRRDGLLVEITRDTKWGNPYSETRRSRARFIVRSREEAIAKHAEWLLLQPDLMRALHELKGKTLACVCLPKLCHGTTLAQFAEAYPVIRHRGIERYFVDGELRGAGPVVRRPPMN